MKKILRLLVVALLAVGSWSCDLTASDDEQVEQLEITTNNISGSWKLVVWNGDPLKEGTYVYIDFVRADGTYTMYQNIDSFSTRTITGRYALYIDEELGVAVLRGNYDHGAGEWNRRYIVEYLTKSEMRLVAMDNADDVSIYERCDIPAEIVGSK